MNNKIQIALDDHITIAKTLYELKDKIDYAHLLIKQVLETGGTVYWIGNGGSAADCQHMAAEFVGRFRKERKPLKSVALTTDTSIITAIGNDYGYDSIFKRQIRGLVTQDDLVVGISTSGYSKNVMLGLDEAKKIGADTIGLLGNNGGLISQHVDVALAIESHDTARVQECHILIGHILCELLDDDFT